MQPAGLGAGSWCLILSALLGTLTFAPRSRAQASQAQPTLETPQQVNDRIRELSASLRVRPHDYVIGPGDLLSIDVFDVKELSREVRVSQTGTIGIPLVPVRLHVVGLTEMQAEQKIAEVLEADGLVTHPDVSVTVKERKSKPITIVGAVPHPMVYQADRPVTLLEVLAEAGGVASDAGDTVIVSRPVLEAQQDVDESQQMTLEQPIPNNITKGGSSPKASTSSSTGAVPNSTNSPENTPALTAPPSATGSSTSSGQAEPPALANTITVNLHDLMENGDTRNNLPLQAGDIVTVPHAGIVYVLGAVRRPGGFVLANDRTQMTTMKVLALAGGPIRTASYDKAVVVRKDDQGQQHEVALDLKKILNRQAEDLQLQPSDILYVPESGAKQALFRTVELAIALGSGLALYRIAYQ